MIFSGNVPGDEDLTCFPLDESNTMNLLRAKSKDFFGYFCTKPIQIPPPVLKDGTDILVLRKLPGGKSFAQFVRRAKKINYASFISSLFTELL